MLSSQGSEGLAETEARTGLAKPDLELQKLALEIKFLARQLSWQGNTLGSHGTGTRGASREERIEKSRNWL